MHKFKILTLFVATIVACSSEEEIKKPDVTFNSNIILEFFIDPTITSASPIDFSASKTIDATQGIDASNLKYVNTIKNYAVDEISFVITQYSGPFDATLKGVVFTTSDDKQIAWGKTVEFAYLNIPSVPNRNYMQPFGYPKDFDELEKKLIANKTQTVKLKGTVSSTPMSFKVFVYVNLIITAEAL